MTITNIFHYKSIYIYTYIYICSDVSSHNRVSTQVSQSFTLLFHIFPKTSHPQTLRFNQYCPFGQHRFGPVWHTIHHQLPVVIRGLLNLSFYQPTFMRIWDIDHSFYRKISGISHNLRNFYRDISGIFILLGILIHLEYNRY